MNPNASIEQSLVIGGTGLVGGHIVRQLVSAGEKPFALSRSRRCASDVIWFCGDLTKPETLSLSPFSILYCTADAALLPAALPFLINPRLSRIVVFSSTGVLAGSDEEVAVERKVLESLADAEQRITVACERHGVAWTILRPTLIYEEGRDSNITELASLIRRYGFIPLIGTASGLRQPVHARDLAIGAVAAAGSAAAINKLYCLPGGETLNYREMIGRIFDGLGKPRRIVALPAWLWKATFTIMKPLLPSSGNTAMGTRMLTDLVFDAAPAVRDFGWNPRRFRPVFCQDSRD
jgi:nucleoside-diphosphate-sugar epimerase